MVKRGLKNGVKLPARTLAAAGAADGRRRQSASRRSALRDGGEAGEKGWRAETALPNVACFAWDQQGARARATGAWIEDLSIDGL